MPLGRPSLAPGSSHMHLADLRQKLGYLIWVVGEHAAIIGVPRFVLFPIGAYIIGKEDFGLFITAYSVAAVVGETPAHGMGIGVLREMKRVGPERERQLCRTAMDLCHRVVVAVVVIGLVAIIVAGGLRLISAVLALCLAALVLSLYPQNQVMVALTELRYHRRFRDRTTWFGIQAACATVAGLMGAATRSPVGLATGFALGQLVALSPAASPTHRLVGGGFRSRGGRYAQVGLAAYVDCECAGVLRAVSQPHPTQRLVFVRRCLRPVRRDGHHGLIYGSAVGGQHTADEHAVGPRLVFGFAATSENTVPAVVGGRCGGDADRPETGRAVRAATHVSPVWRGGACGCSIL